MGCRLLDELDFVPPFRPRKRGPTAEDITLLVALRTDVPVTAMRSPDRHKDVMRARHVAMFLIREITGRSFKRIAESFGRTDHTTAMGACAKVRAEMATDERMRMVVDGVRRDLRVEA